MLLLEMYNKFALEIQGICQQSLFLSLGTRKLLLQINRLDTLH